MKRIQSFVSSLVGLLALSLFVLTSTPASAYQRHGEDYIEVSDDFSAFIEWGYAGYENIPATPAVAYGTASSEFLRAASGNCDAFLEVSGSVDQPGPLDSEFTCLKYKFTSYEEEFYLSMDAEQADGSMDAIPYADLGYGGSISTGAYASDSSGFSYYEDSHSTHWY